MGQQPFLHDLVVALAAPTQVWCGPDGQVRAQGAQGAYHGDVRVLSAAVLTIGGAEPEPLGAAPDGSGCVTTVALARAVDGPGADPTTRVDRRRQVTPGGFEERVLLTCSTAEPVVGEVVLAVRADATPTERVKSGLSGDAPQVVVGATTARWRSRTVEIEVSAPGARLVAVGADGVDLVWAVRVESSRSVELVWRLTAVDPGAVVSAPASREPEWSRPLVTADDPRLAPMLEQALDDLAGLRMRTGFSPDDTFLAAGAPWFFTLFGRDSLWAARMLLPLGTDLAAGTLRTLAARQGTVDDPRTAEQPGKILHELRRGELVLGDSGLVLPPLYYGTVDATLLWVCLLHDAWRWGMPADQVEALLPACEAALGWMAGPADPDGDGFLEYRDTLGTGLANQGWKDSGDSVQWRDGALAAAPIALVEVQGYAHEAALAGAALLDAFGRPGADRWREFAAALATRFRESFWVHDEVGAYPGIALDADKHVVDSLTSNIGHLLGTGLLDVEEEAAVAARLVSDELDSGRGLRTLARSSAGYWPLRYHGGAVWPHDTAIAMAGLARSGHRAAAARLAEGLLRGGEDLGWRMSELWAGDSTREARHTLAYPAACRPQAWAAASAVVVLSTTLGLRPDVPAGRLVVDPAVEGGLDVRGLRLAGSRLDVRVERDRSVDVRTDAPVRVEVPGGADRGRALQ